MIGAGGWGTAMIKVLAAGNPDVWLYCRNPVTAEELRETRENKAYLPGVRIPDQVKITSDLEEAVWDADCVILCTPSMAAESMAAAVAPYLKKQAVVVSASKGLASHGGLRLSQVIGEKLASVTDRIAVLSGPNHASRRRLLRRRWRSCRTSTWARPSGSIGTATSSVSNMAAR